MMGKDLTLSKASNGPGDNPGSLLISVFAVILLVTFLRFPQLRF